MTEKGLKIIEDDLKWPARSSSPFQNTLTGRLNEARAKFERLWLLHPQRFDPLRNCRERLRIERTWQLLKKNGLVKNQKACDLGCGSGFLSRKLRDHGAQVEAIEIAENALKKFREMGCEDIILKQDAMPSTSLKDHFYDIVICTDIIANIAAEDYRLFFAELSRLITPDGLLICSSPIDIDTQGGAERLVSFAQAEFDIIEEKPSYHALHIRLQRFFKAPVRFYNKMKLKKSLSLWMKPFYWLSGGVSSVLQPICHLFEQNDKLLLRLEKICCFFCDTDGISHYLFAAKRRPMIEINKEDAPRLKPGKHEVWE